MMFFEFAWSLDRTVKCRSSREQPVMKYYQVGILGSVGEAEVSFGVISHDQTPVLE